MLEGSANFLPEEDRESSIGGVNTNDDDQTNTAKKQQHLVTIPTLPKSFAIFCLVCNVTVPGLGTVLSALSVVYFHDKNDSYLEIVSVSLSNLVVGLCQLLTVVFLLIGWFWSIIWGCALVGRSNEYKKTRAVRSVGIRLTVKSASFNGDVD